MIHKLVPLLAISLSLIVNAQKIENNSKLISKAKQELKPELNTFFSECLLKNECSECVENLILHATDPFKMYLIGGALFNIDAEKSYELHKKAFDRKQHELNFNLEYAIELHRRGQYTEAIPYYLIYKQKNKTDYRIDVWLSECYINSGDLEKSIEHWKASNHPENHTGIDKAIHTIHGSADQISRRSKLRSEISSKKKIDSAYDLIYLDLNWEIDWWNSKSQDYFVEQDLQLISETFGTRSEVYQDASAYIRIKQLAAKNEVDSIKAALIDLKLIINKNRLIPNGKITSDILRIAFIHKIANESDFFNERKNDILQLADQKQDGELLNIYAYLEAVVNGHVAEETDIKGWQKYQDERFAVSYFFGLADKNRYDNPDFKQALSDFPNSAELQWIKLNCAMIENIDFTTDLIELIKKDFKTLQSDQNRYSYGLKNYFYLLENGK